MTKWNDWFSDLFSTTLGFEKHENPRTDRFLNANASLSDPLSKPRKRR